MGMRKMAEDIDEFTTKPISELDISKMFEEEYEKTYREILEKLVHIVTGYITGVANRASQLLRMNIYVTYGYSFEPDGVKFEIKFVFDQKSIEKLKKQVMERVEKKWVKIKLAEKYIRNKELEKAS
jgi:hypothetical protein